jgi:signal transduction histidine kinase
VDWWRRSSLRARLTLISAAGLAAGLALGGTVLVLALAASLRHALEAGAAQTAGEVASLVDAGAVPDPIPVAGSQLVQVVDRADRVRTGSAGADRLVPLATPEQLAAVRSGRVLSIDGERAGIDGPLWLTGRAAGRPSDPLTVVVAVPAGDAVRTVRVLRTVLLIAFPLLLVGLAVLAWRVIGLALRPVEALRAGADEITGTGSTGRLPVPDSRDELHRLAVTLNGMLARLEAGRGRQRAFVADAAHELRSPLANMRTELEVAQRLAGDTDWPRLTADLLTDVERLSRLVDDLLLLARADDEPPPLRHLAEVDLGELARQAADARAAARVPVTAVVDGAGEVGVTGDADALRRIVDNLVDNAVRHARSEVRVEVGLEPGPVPGSDGAGAARALIAVVDDGPGIPASDAQRVFERFTRLDDARSRDAGGAGLGLAIVAELVRRHGGEVCLKDAAPGLRAEVLLPRRLEP